MPTRSIQVKLVLARGDGGKPLRQSLWATHAAVNEATKFYEQTLLLMRGESHDDEIASCLRGKGYRLANGA